jgi:transposase
MNVTTLGIDLAKNTFSLHGVDAHGKNVFRKTLSRAKLMPFLAQQPAYLIGMEACSGSHHWAGQLTALGHRVGIMTPKFVIPYRKGGKNDGNDAKNGLPILARRAIVRSLFSERLVPRSTR